MGGYHCLMLANVAGPGHGAETLSQASHATLNLIPQKLTGLTADISGSYSVI